MTIDTLIEQLTKLKATVGGDAPVVLSFNGIMQSGTFLNITEVKNEPYFLPTDDEFCLVSDYVTEEGDEIHPMVHLFSNRDVFSP